MPARERSAPEAYDTELADRIRFLIGTAPGVTEKKMFGGLAFMVGGNMAISASGRGGALVRVDPTETGVLLATANWVDIARRLQPAIVTQRHRRSRACATLSLPIPCD